MSIYHGFYNLFVLWKFISHVLNILFMFLNSIFPRYSTCSLFLENIFPLDTTRYSCSEVDLQWIPYFISALEIYFPWTQYFIHVSELDIQGTQNYKRRLVSQGRPQKPISLWLM